MVKTLYRYICSGNLVASLHPIAVLIVAFQNSRAVLAAIVATRSKSFDSHGETQVRLGLLLHFSICSPLCLSHRFLLRLLLRFFAHQSFRILRVLG